MPTNPIPPELVACLREQIAQITARAYGGSLYPGLGTPGDYPTADEDYRAADAIAALINPSPLDREAVARIIDPVAFTDKYIGNRDYLHGDGVHVRRQARRAAVLVKADAIIALLPAHPVEQEPVEEWEGPLTGKEQAMIDAAWEKHKAAAPCPLPPDGWRCSRGIGHEGPCAAHPVEPQPVQPEFPSAPTKRMEEILGVPFERKSEGPQPVQTGGVDGFQARVQPWMMACFGEVIAADREERNHRFLEEALELVQSCGCTASEAHQLVDYVYGRAIGEPAQEVGGVMVTLAALCLANGLDMHANGESELARIWGKVEAIRAKQAARPKHSPLPIATPTPVPAFGGGALREAVKSAIYAAITPMIDALRPERARDGSCYLTAAHVIEREVLAALSPDQSQGNAAEGDGA